MAGHPGGPAHEAQREDVRLLALAQREVVPLLAEYLVKSGVAAQELAGLLPAQGGVTIRSSDWR